MSKTEISKRIVTATCLASATVAAILLLESILFAITVGLITSAAAWEWCRLGRSTVALGWNISFILLVGAGVPALLVAQFWLPWMLSIALVWWICVANLILSGTKRSQPLRWQAKKWQALLVIFAAAAAITALHATESDGRW